MSFGIYAIQFYVQSSLPLLRRFLLVSLCYITINNFLYEPHAGLPQMRTIPKDCSRSKKSKIGATILIMTI